MNVYVKHFGIVLLLYLNVCVIASIAASCELVVEKDCVFPHRLPTTCMLTTQDVVVFSTKAFCFFARTTHLDPGWPNC